jgi:CRP-like cAMP-binding protein
MTVNERFRIDDTARVRILTAMGQERSGQRRDSDIEARLLVALEVCGGELNAGQEQIAELVNTCRETVSRTLARLRERGIVATGSKSVKLIAMAA